jgi:hypothetical protein
MLELTLRGASFGNHAEPSRRQARRLARLCLARRFVDLVITATSVAKSTGAVVRQETAGETITAGMPVYLHTDGLVYKTDVDGSSAAQACLGIALNGGAINQPIAVQTDGTITIGATVAVGVIYVASDTAGGIMPSADLETGDKVIILGVADTTSTLEMHLWDSGTTFA